MIFEINHHMLYSFKTPVYLEPHELHLHPRNAPFQKISNFKLTIDPEPAILSEFLDLEGNRQSTIYFNNITDHLEISTSFRAETFLYSPYDFIIYPFESETLPISYSEVDSQLLRPYLGTEPNPLLEAYGKEVAEESQWATLPFLTNLTSKIHATIKHEESETKEPMSPASTLECKKGSSVDHAQFQMAICRSMGFATRFANGYYFGNEINSQQLHAWIEVYIPGAGWRGFDPTFGIPVSNKHVLLSASAYSSHIHPVNGSVLGSCQATVKHEVSIKKIEKEKVA